VGAIPIGSIDPVRRSYDDEVDFLSVLRTAGHASHFGGDIANNKFATQLLLRFQRFEGFVLLLIAMHRNCHHCNRNHLFGQLESPSGRKYPSLIDFEESLLRLV
jgi:hypothetical protein